MTGTTGTDDSSAPRKEQGTAAAVSEPSVKTGLVLLAEDEEQVRNGLSRFLSAQGHTVIEAKNGNEAVSLARERNPDLVLLDITMPGKNGIEVLKELVPGMTGTGFIMVTGNEDEETALSCLQLGAFDYLPKPVDLEALAHCVNAWLMLHKPAAG